MFGLSQIVKSGRAGKKSGNPTETGPWMQEMLLATASIQRELTALNELLTNPAGKNPADRRICRVCHW
jgi:hypothetical protein